MTMNINSLAFLSIPLCLCVACGSIPSGPDRAEPGAVAAASAAPASAVDKHRFSAGSHSLRSLVDTAALRTHRIWVVHPGEMEGAPAIDMQSAVEVADADIEAFVSELLWSRGFVVVARKAAADALEVVSMNGPRASEVLAEAPLRSVDEVMAQPACRAPVRVTLQLEHVNANIVMNSMRPFFAQSARSASLVFGTAGSNSVFVISGIQSEVAQAVALIRAVDKPDAGAEKQVTDLQVEITNLRAQIQQLEKQLEKQQAQKKD